MRRYFWKIACWLLVGWACVACEDEVDPLPAYVQTLADLQVGPDVVRQTLTLEDGRTLGVLNPVGGFPADTLARVYAIYVEDEAKGGVRLYGLQRVFSPRAEAIPAEEVRRDPVKVISVWKTGTRWLNLHLGIMSGGQAHTCAFAEEWEAAVGDRPAKVRITLYHDRGDDGEFYTEDAYLCCPLRHYADSLRAGVDSVEVRVQAYDGEVVRSFLY